jgi:hypothetical protein
MKSEYDFSKAARGKFYRKGAELRLPIYLDAKLQEQLERLAEKSGKEIGEMVNQLVRKEMGLSRNSLEKRGLLCHSGIHDRVDRKHRS